jgi:ketosteroid isomerase-like protein
VEGAASEEEATDVVRRSIEALNARDMDAVMACFTDDVIFDGSRIMEGTYRGKQSYREFLEEAVDRVDFHHSEVSLLTDEDRVIALADVRGAGDRSGIPLAGRMAYVYEVREGLIARQEIHPDGEALLASIGLNE